MTYNLNSGSWDGAAGADSYTYGTGLTLPTNIIRAGYTFARWYDNAQLTGSPITAIGVTDIDDKNFYAKWTLVAPTISITTGEFSEIYNGTPFTLTASASHASGLPILHINGIRTERPYPARQIRLTP